MKVEVFLSDELQKIIDTKALQIGLTTGAYITDQLENIFKDELNNVPSKSYATLYSELKAAVIAYTSKLKPNTTFTLKDIPYYKNLGVVTANKNTIVPAVTRARLGKSINKEIASQSPSFSNISRATTKSGKLAFKDGAAVYRIV